MKLKTETNTPEMESVSLQRSRSVANRKPTKQQQTSSTANGGSPRRMAPNTALWMLKAGKLLTVSTSS